MSGLLTTRELRVAVPNRVLVDSFECAVRAGEFIALLGSNGAGKSLLLRTLAGLRPASGGSVHLAHAGTTSRTPMATPRYFI